MIKCNMNVISEQIEENKHEPIITKLYAIEKG